MASMYLKTIYHYETRKEASSKELVLLKSLLFAGRKTCIVRTRKKQDCKKVQNKRARP